MRARGLLRTLAVATIALAAVGFAACSVDSLDVTSPEDASADGVIPPPEPDAAPDGPIATGAVDLQILAISDWRGQLGPIVENDSSGLPQPYGGLPALAALFAAEREKQPNTIVVATGDSFGASPVLSSYEGDEPAAKGLDFLRMTANTFGEHDFAGGTAKLASLIGMTRTKFVSTNLASVVGELGPKPVTPFLRMDVGEGANKATVAILGLSNADIAKLRFPQDLGAIAASDPLTAANDSASAARLLGADVVIALAHIGAAKGGGAGPLLDLAKHLEGVDIVFGGQTDVEVNTTVTNMSGAPVLVVQNRNAGRTYARVQMTVSNGQLAKPADVKIIDPQVTQLARAVCDAGADGGCICPAAPCPNASYVCDPVTGLCKRPLVDVDEDAGTFVDAHRAGLGAYLDTALAVANDAFPNDGSEGAHETALGDLVADALLDTYRTAFGAQIALVAAGRIRASLPSPYVPTATGLHRASPPYDLVVGDTLTAFPLGDTVVLRSLSGTLLWQALEHAVAAAPARSPAFLQVAGVRVTYSLGADAGMRVKAVVLEENGMSIPPDDTTEYVVAMTDFTSAGGDGYGVLVEAPPAAPTPGRDLVTDVVAAYVKAISPIAPAALTRIMEVP